mmetsp:Transcript_116180/g.339807  ORF Transcript_116180/g.339807 Transcript_116180/m.339807 type:complete len:218 (+) Transcript_116180:139-792(+)
MPMAGTGGNVNGPLVDCGDIRTGCRRRSSSRFTWQSPAVKLLASSAMWPRSSTAPTGHQPPASEARDGNLEPSCPHLPSSAEPGVHVAVDVSSQPGSAEPLQRRWMPGWRAGASALHLQGEAASKTWRLSGTSGTMRLGSSGDRQGARGRPRAAGVGQVARGGISCQVGSCQMGSSSGGGGGRCWPESSREEAVRSGGSLSGISTGSSGTASGSSDQ